MASAQPKPAWLTDELADVDDWIDWQDEDQSADPDQSGSELSFTQPLGSVLVRNNDLVSSNDASESDNSGGTFIVREEMPAVPLLPKTPGRNKKALVKDFFSPLALEKMFEPPSPPQSSAPLPPQTSRATAVPAVPSRLSQVHVPPSEPSNVEEDEQPRPASAASIQSNDALGVNGAQCMFTFTAPRPSPFNPAGPAPDAQSTPGPNHLARTLNPPPTDPRLRLFQFQYDTFTRDHLSAMVDSIAVNTPSGEGGPTNQGSQHTTPSDQSSGHDHEASFSRLRSAKRLKLSPASDFNHEPGDGAAVIMRPVSRRDYVGESKNLMEQIRKARDFSTVSTVATVRSPAAERVDSPDQSVKQKELPLRRPSFLLVPENGSSKDPTPNGTTSSRRSGYSSLGYRQQAASLMEQIRNDMKGSKRLFSGDTELSQRRNDDTTEASILTADNTVPSLRSRNSDPNTLTGSRRPSVMLSQSRRTSVAVNNRLSSISRGKQRAGSSPRKPSVARSSHVSQPSEDHTREISEEFSRMSLETSRMMLAQFPAPPSSAPSAPPVHLVSASTSTAPPSPVKPSPGLLAPPTAFGTVPAYPSSSLRAGRNEDLTRFVSSSTASGTTLTAGSAESFVKHAGPKQSTQMNIMHIKPSDVGALPDRVGKMVFDRVMMRWVKATALATAGMTEREAPLGVGSGLGASVVAGSSAQEVLDVDQDNESEDPFRDIESLREDDSVQQTVGDEDGQTEDEDSMILEKSRIEDALSEVVDAEEAELTSFSTDGPSDFVEDLPPDEGGEGAADMSYTDSEGPHDRDEDTGGTVPTATLDLQLERHRMNASIEEDPTMELAFADTPPTFLAAAPRGPAMTATPNPPHRSVSGITPIPRSALKSASITPVSALKDPCRSKMQTPANRIGHRRSVSFSDGKHDGPILGIGRNVPTPDGSAIGDDDSPLASGSRLTESAILVPSARSKRIADMLGDLENTEYENDSPSKNSTSSRALPDELHPLQPRRPSTGPGCASGSSRQVSRRTSAHPSQPLISRSANANATFLTECSFGVAHDRLVQVITDVQPFEPYWEELTSIDLSNRNIDSTARLKEFLPRLDSLSLNSNQLPWLSGVPSSVRTLSVASNLLTGVTSFSHLLNLENLDISRNQVDSLRQLECLRHLRELRADGNRIDNLDGLHDFKW